MPQFLRFSFYALLGSTLTALVLADEKQPEQPEAKEEKTSPADVKKEEANIEAKSKEIRTRTTLYDTQSIQELYSKLEKKKAEAARNAPDHLNTEDMDLVELAPLRVEGYKIRNERELMQKMDPRPMQALERLAILDPELANELLVARRNDEAFMAGENDRTGDRDAGRAATLNAKQMLEAFEKTQEATRKVLGGKRKAEPETP
ncbi:MAG: hypothetical protein AAGB46_17585 [Verrucomicrobiota bacterium]